MKTILILLLLAAPVQAAEYRVTLTDEKDERMVERVCYWYGFFGSRSDARPGETDKEFALRKIQEETGMTIEVIE